MISKGKREKVKEETCKRFERTIKKGRKKEKLDEDYYKKVGRNETFREVETQVQAKAYKNVCKKTLEVDE